MKLNLPILSQISHCKNLLIAGMGGGFDIFCGLPIYLELQQLGINCHLANLSFSNITFSAGADIENRLKLTETLVGVNYQTQDLKLVYFPELYLAQWFQEKHQQDITIWCFKKTGVQPLIDNYSTLIKHLSIDGILLIDGGVDSLIRGDEDEMATLLEDAVSLLAVSQFPEISTKLIGCVGFGAERDITYAHILENIAALAATGDFLGSCSLLRQMETYQKYEDAVLYVQNKRFQDPSVINSSIISAVQGHYGDYHLTTKTHGSKLWISPLMSIYWFFDLQAVVQRHLFLEQFLLTNSFNDVMKVMMMILQMKKKRTSIKKIPL